MDYAFICIGLSVRLFSHGALFNWFFERVFHIRKGGKQYYIGQLCRICEYLGNVVRYRIRTAYFILFPYKSRINNTRILRAHRKESILANLILSAIITPGDVSSQLIVAFPIFILYEISILISAWVNKSNVKI
ncbi:MAG: twin-arginine translocase subunit TatC [Bacteroidetes bacterium]|nr:twin-arginine translocase subunit TatC [Bacteroidota bacterium]